MMAIRSPDSGCLEVTPWNCSVPTENPQSWTFTTPPLSHTLQAEQWHFHPNLSLNSASPQKSEVNPNPEESLPSLPPCLALRPELLACCLQPCPPVRGRCAFAPHGQEHSAPRICTEPLETQVLFLTQALCTE